jgi:hypothetical protein
MSVKRFRAFFAKNCDEAKLRQKCQEQKPCHCNLLNISG